MQFRVEKNIPIWAPANRKRPIAEVVERMEFGDSIMVREENHRNNLVSAITLRNHKAVTRQVIENNKVIGWRVWKQPKDVVIRAAGA